MKADPRLDDGEITITAEDENPPAREQFPDSIADESVEEYQPTSERSNHEKRNLTARIKRVTELLHHGHNLAIAIVIFFSAIVGGGKFLLREWEPDRSPLPVPRQHEPEKSTTPDPTPTPKVEPNNPLADTTSTVGNNQALNSGNHLKTKKDKSSSKTRSTSSKTPAMAQVHSREVPPQAMRIGVPYFYERLQNGQLVPHVVQSIAAIPRTLGNAGAERR